jgi:hypothetical protein
LQFLSFLQQPRDKNQRQFGEHTTGSPSLPNFEKLMSPRLLWRMKAVTHREKDADNLAFLRAWFAEREETPPEV